MAEVKAPNSAYNGTGPGGAAFVDGVALVEDESALNYYRSAGYAVDGEVQAHAQAGQPEPPDPREVGEVVGSRLRDAAVDPEPGDYLPPTNAGTDNPHGSSVVSPEIHASGPKGIRPGEVHADDLDRQAARETAFAEARLVEQAAAAEAVAGEVPDVDDRGELNLSDPGSADAGRKDAEAEAEAEPEPEPEAEAESDGQDSDDSDDSDEESEKPAAKKAASRRTSRK